MCLKLRACSTTLSPNTAFYFRWLQILTSQDNGIAEHPWHWKHCLQLPFTLLTLWRDAKAWRPGNLGKTTSCRYWTQIMQVSYFCDVAVSGSVLFTDLRTLFITFYQFKMYDETGFSISRPFHRFTRPISAPQICTYFLYTQHVPVIKWASSPVDNPCRNPRHWKTALFLFCSGIIMQDIFTVYSSLWMLQK